MTETLGTKQRRTRAALYAAVLDLAAERDPTALGVTEIATRAGVHRSTFYEHATSPLDLLRSALRAELDAERERHLVGIGPDGLGAALREVALAVFAHIDARASVYRRIDEAPGVSLHALLSAHFAESSRMLVDAGLLDIPIDEPGLPREHTVEAAVRFVADGVVGLVAVWLTTPEPRDPHVPLRLFEQLEPAWWPRADR